MRTLEKGTWLKAKDGSNYAKFYYYETEEKNAKGGRKKSEVPTCFFRADDKVRSLPRVNEKIFSLRLDEYEEVSDAERTLLESLYRILEEKRKLEWQYGNKEYRLRFILQEIDAERAEEAFSSLDEAKSAVDEITKRIDDAVKLTGQKYISADLITQGIKDAEKIIGNARSSVETLIAVVKDAERNGAKYVVENAVENGVVPAGEGRNYLL